MRPQQPGRDGFGPLDALGLTGDQRATINDLQRTSRDQAAPLEDELEFVQKSLHRELFADKRDPGKITSLTARVAALQKQLADVHVKTSTSVSDVLTGKQRETMRLTEGRGRGGRGRV
jgi:Spy/CpxP family protein refolding chaperone